MVGEKETPSKSGDTEINKWNGKRHENGEIRIGKRVECEDEWHNDKGMTIFPNGSIFIGQV